MILGSNKDEVKLWLGTADYFVDIEYSLIGEFLNIPKDNWKSLLIQNGLFVDIKGILPRELNPLRL